MNGMSSQSSTVVNMRTTLQVVERTIFIYESPLCRHCRHGGLSFLSDTPRWMIFEFRWLALLYEADDLTTAESSALKGLRAKNIARRQPVTTSLTTAGKRQHSTTMRAKEREVDTRTSGSRRLLMLFLAERFSDHRHGQRRRYA
jgi:hypothetical protein